MSAFEVARNKNVYSADPKGKETNKIPGGVYRVITPMMGSPFLARESVFEERIIEDSKGWDFNGSDAHKIVHKDFDAWVGGIKHFGEIGARHRRGIILHGPPGTGKSVVAQSIVKRAIDEDIPVVFFTASTGGVLMEIQSQNKHRPMVVICDEMEEEESGLHTVEFLVGSFFLGTTNELDSMHHRVTRRPGRFDRIILVDRMTPGMIRRLCEQFKIPEAEAAISKHYPTVTPAVLTEISFRIRLLGEAAEQAVNEVKESFNHVC